VHATVKVERPVLAGNMPNVRQIVTNGTTEGIKFYESVGFARKVCRDDESIEANPYASAAMQMAAETSMAAFHFITIQLSGPIWCNFSLRKEDSTNTSPSDSS
jgi:hypothetical protein